MKDAKLFFKERDWLFDILTWASLIGVSGAIIGIFYFPISMIMYGFVWWNVTGSVVCFIICCIPMAMEKYEKWRNNY